TCTSSSTWPTAPSFPPWSPAAICPGATPSWRSAPRWRGGPEQPGRALVLPLPGGPGGQPGEAPGDPVPVADLSEEGQALLAGRRGPGGRPPVGQPVGQPGPAYPVREHRHR